MAAHTGCHFQNSGNSPLVSVLSSLGLKQLDKYLLYGNHDADSEMTKGLGLPNNVHAFASRKAETFRIEP